MGKGDLKTRRGKISNKSFVKKSRKIKIKSSNHNTKEYLEPICNSNIKNAIIEMDIINEPVEEIYSVFNSIASDEHLFIPFILKRKERIIRMRINEKDRSFHNISELGYPPRDCLKEYGRVNLPYHSIFYGSIFSIDPNAALPRVIVAGEVSEFLRDTSSNGIEKQTYSSWSVLEELHLIALPFSNNYERACNDILSIKKKWAELSSKGTISQPSKDLADYMSQEISKKVSMEKEYFIIANYIYFLLYMNKYTNKFDGIVYPTVQLDGNGFNIAIKPDIVDKKMKFEAAVECHMIKRGLVSTILNIKDVKLTNEYGDLEYSPNKTFDLDEYNKFIKGLTFIN